MSEQATEWELREVCLELYPDTVFLSVDHLMMRVSDKQNVLMRDARVQIERLIETHPNAVPYTCIGTTCIGLRYGVEHYEYFSF